VPWAQIPLGVLERLGRRRRGREVSCMRHRSPLQATRRLEGGAAAGPPSHPVTKPIDQWLRREHSHNRLVDLVKPYVCSMSHMDVVFGHEGTGKTAQLQQACRSLPTSSGPHQLAAIPPQIPGGGGPVFLVIFGMGFTSKYIEIHRNTLYLHVITRYCGLSELPTIIGGLSISIVPFSKVSPN
jgi:hypothetical protein